MLKLLSFNLVVKLVLIIISQSKKRENFVGQQSYEFGCQVSINGYQSKEGERVGKFNRMQKFVDNSPTNSVVKLVRI